MPGGVLPTHWPRPEVTFCTIVPSRQRSYLVGSPQPVAFWLHELAVGAHEPSAQRNRLAKEPVHMCAVAVAGEGSVEQSVRLLATHWPSQHFIGRSYGQAVSTFGHSAAVRAQKPLAQTTEA